MTSTVRNICSHPTSSLREGILHQRSECWDWKLTTSVWKIWPWRVQYAVLTWTLNLPVRLQPTNQNCQTRDRISRDWTGRPRRWSAPWNDSTTNRTHSFINKDDRRSQPHSCSFLPCNVALPRTPHPRNSQNPIAIAIISEGSLVTWPDYAPYGYSFIYGAPEAA